jgi:hypothetical protein
LLVMGGCAIDDLPQGVVRLWGCRRSEASTECSDGFC